MLELSIDDVAFGGKGVARDEGKAVFIPFTIDGERVRARITRKKKTFAEAELDEVLKISPERVVPECPYFGRCGGCSYQHISYEHQLALKWRQVQEILRRIGKLDPVPMRPIVPSSLAYGYRNRITVHSQDGVIGFYRRDAHQLIDVEACSIAAPDVNESLARLRADHVKDGHYTLRARAGPRIFSQANESMGDALAASVGAMIPPSQKLLVDAYCGSGFFAKRLLERFERVFGIDWDRHAVVAAKENATEKETYIAGEIEAELHPILETIALPSTVVIVDPPAAGLAEAVRRALLEFSPAVLIYVSCNPPTLARDLAALSKRFEVQSVTPFDMFPQTAEIEVAVSLQTIA